jgi:putative oxidoreductase
MKRLIYWTFTPPVTGSSNILIIRGLTATLCCWQGTQQLIHETVIPLPAIVEIIGGILVLLGLLTRLTALTLMIITILLANPIPPGLITAFTQLLSCLFLLLEGPGRRSIDFFIATSGKVYRMP